MHVVGDVGSISPVAEKAVVTASMSAVIKAAEAVMAVMAGQLVSCIPAAKLFRVTLTLAVYMPVAEKMQVLPFKRLAGERTRAPAVLLHCTHMPAAGIDIPAMLVTAPPQAWLIVKPTQKHPASPVQAEEEVPAQGRGTAGVGAVLSRQYAFPMQPAWPVHDVLSVFP